MQFKGKSSEVVTDHKLNKTQKCPAGTKKGSTILGCRNRETARHLEQPFALHLALRKLHVGPCPYSKRVWLKWRHGRGRHWDRLEVWKMWLQSRALTNGS